MTLHPAARLTLGADRYAVLEIASGPLGSLRLTLDRPLNIPTRCREPVRLVEPPAGARVRVRAVY